MELSTSNVFREMELFSPSLKNKKKRYLIHYIVVYILVTFFLDTKNIYDLSDFI